MIPRDFFASSELQANELNCRVEYFVDSFNDPSNMCVKQTGGISAGWCCKYAPRLSSGAATGKVPSGAAIGSEVSQCWTACASWEEHAADMKV